MDLPAFRLLLTPSGQEVLQAALDLQPQEGDFLRHFTTLSRRYPPELARAALETAILRGEAVHKFPAAAQLYFTRQALEQASSHAVSVYRSERFRAFHGLVDLGCSIGGDTLALAVHAPTLGLDIDPLRLAMAQTNARLLDLGDRTTFVQADLIAPLPLKLSSVFGLFFDPARRTAGRRVFSVQDYLPRLAVVEDWLPHSPALAVKISPGVKLAELQAYDAEVEFISLRGELKEAVLWFGPLKTAYRRATLLPGPHTLSSSVPPAASSLPLSEPQAYLYEPDPSILRAGLVETLGLRLGAGQLDPDIAYLTANQLASTPFARAWAVEDWFPFGLKRLRAALRQRGVERVVVKKRGSPIQPEDLIRELRLSGGGGPGSVERTVFLTHLRGRPIVILSTGEVSTG